MQNVPSVSPATGIESTHKKYRQPHGKTHGKQDGKQIVAVVYAAASAAVFCAMAAWPTVQATPLPEGAHLVKGAVNIHQTGGDHPVMTIQQQEQLALVEWQTFDIAENASVHVQSGNPSSLLINRVTGAASSAINGSLQADGAVWLVNPNGYLLGEHAVISADEFLVSTRNIDSEALLNAANVLRNYGSETGHLIGVTDPRDRMGEAMAGGSRVNVQHVVASPTGQPSGSNAALPAVRSNAADRAFSDSDNSDTSDGPVARSGTILPVPYPLVMPQEENQSPPSRGFLSYDERAVSPGVVFPPPPSPALSARRVSGLPASPSITVGMAAGMASDAIDRHAANGIDNVNANASANADANADANANADGNASGSALLLAMPQSPPIRSRQLGARARVQLPEEPFAQRGWVDSHAVPVTTDDPLLYDAHDASAYHDYAALTRVPSRLFSFPTDLFSHPDHHLDSDTSEEW